MSKPAAPDRRDWKIFLALITAVFGWAFAWVGIRAAVRDYDPGSLAFGRYLVASLVLLPVWALRGRSLPRLPDWSAVLVMGFFGFTFYNLAINEAEKTITAGTAALIAAIIPVLNTIGARIWFRERVGRSRWGGMAVALCGVAIIAISAEGRIEISTGALLVLLASCSAAIYGLVVKQSTRRYAALDVTTWAIWAGTLLLIPFGLHLPETVATAPTGATLNVIFLGIFPGAISYVAMSYAIAHWPMARAISFLYAVPPLSVLLGWLFLEELPAPFALIGGAIALAGVVWVQTASPDT